MSEENHKLQVINMKNIAHGQLNAMFEASWLKFQEHYRNDPTAKYEISTRTIFFQNRDTGYLQVRPRAKFTKKNEETFTGIEVNLVVNEDGIFQVKAGKQMQLDTADDDED